jgi:ATP-dependent helicase HrpB
MLGAIDEQSKITSRGRTIAQLGVHPRIGRLLTGDESMSNRAVSCWVAAALSEAKVAPDFSQDTLISERISFAQASRAPSALRVTEEARRIAELLQIPFHELNRPCDSEAIAIATAKAFPERVAMKRMGANDTYLTREGLGVVTRNSTLTRHEFLAIAHLDGKGANARVLVAEPLPQDSVLQLFKEDIAHATIISWDRDSQSVRALEEHRLDSLILKASPMRPDENEARELLLAELVRDELRPLPWSATLVEVIDRVEWLNARGALPQTLRPLLRAALLTEVDLWLTDSLHGKSSYRELSALPLEELIWSRISWKDRALLDSCAPPRIPLPSGRSAAICYSGERAPSISVKLQEMFGLQAHPSIAQNTVPLTIELLSPAGRPLQITRDIKSFWQSAYPAVRREMAGRYPKHPWPLDPEQAPATHRAKPRK